MRKLKKADVEVDFSCIAGQVGEAGVLVVAGRPVGVNVFHLFPDFFALAKSPHGRRMKLAMQATRLPLQLLGSPASATMPSCKLL